MLQGENYQLHITILFELNSLQKFFKKITNICKIKGKVITNISNKSHHPICTHRYHLGINQLEIPWVQMKGRWEGINRKTFQIMIVQ